MVYKVLNLFSFSSELLLVQLQPDLVRKKDTALFAVELDLSQIGPQWMDGQLHIALEINEYKL